ncbi:MAG: hypothetical protein FJX61_01655 [Alphaproteobacteria bacterium]|nr:hypothetical protein [Alphaproteobacteria bacterium]
MASFRFDLVVAVWGDLFRGLFEKLCLPSLCTPANLEALGQRGEVKLWLYTPAAEVGRLDVAQLRARIPAAIGFRVVTLEGIGRADHAVRNNLDMSLCHRNAIKTAEERDAVISFIPADSVWAEGALPRMADRIVAGKRAVFLLGTRVTAETFIDVFSSRFLDAARWVARCPARDLIRAALPCLHPITRASFVDSPTFTTWPSTLVWPVGADGLLIRAFHFHPAFVWPRRYGDFALTVDLDFVKNAVDGEGDIHVVTDSDEALQLNLDVENHLPNFLGRAPADPTAIAAWIGGNADPLHRAMFLRHTVRLHAGELGPAWDAAAARSDRFARELLAAAADTAAP